MQKPRTKAHGEGYLSTDEIIRRVQLAQGTAMGRWLHRARTVLFVGLVLGALWGLSFLWRRGLDTYEQSVQGHHGGAQAEVSSGDVAADAPEQASISPASPDAPHGGPGGHAKTTQAHSQVQVTFMGHTPHALFVDGHKVGHDGHGWKGQLEVGKHRLAVQTNGHMLRHSVTFGPGETHVMIDVMRHTFVVKGEQGGHKASRLP
jgi:hypothetical protein